MAEKPVFVEHFEKVLRIEQERLNPQTNTRELLIKWSDETVEPSWEPESCLALLAEEEKEVLLADFRRRNDAKRKLESQEEMEENEEQNGPPRKKAKTLPIIIKREQQHYSDEVHSPGGSSKKKKKKKKVKRAIPSYRRLTRSMSKIKNFDQIRKLVEKPRRSTPRGTRHKQFIELMDDCIEMHPKNELQEEEEKKPFSAKIEAVDISKKKRKSPVHKEADSAKQTKRSRHERPLSSPNNGPYIPELVAGSLNHNSKQLQPQAQEPPPALGPSRPLGPPRALGPPPALESPPALEPPPAFKPPALSPTQGPLAPSAGEHPLLAPVGGNPLPAAEHPSPSPDLNPASSGPPSPLPLQSTETTEAKIKWDDGCSAMKADSNGVAESSLLDSQSVLASELRLERLSPVRLPSNSTEMEDSDSLHGVRRNLFPSKFKSPFEMSYAPDLQNVQTSSPVEELTTQSSSSSVVLLPLQIPNRFWCPDTGPEPGPEPEPEPRSEYVIESEPVVSAGHSPIERPFASGVLLDDDVDNGGHQMEEFQEVPPTKVKKTKERKNEKKTVQLKEKDVRKSNVKRVNQDSIPSNTLQDDIKNLMDWEEEEGSDIPEVFLPPMETRPSGSGTGIGRKGVIFRLMLVIWIVFFIDFLIFGQIEGFIDVGKFSKSFVSSSLILSWLSEWFEAWMPSEGSLLLPFEVYFIALSTVLYGFCAVISPAVSMVNRGGKEKDRFVAEASVTVRADVVLMIIHSLSLFASIVICSVYGGTDRGGMYKAVISITFGFHLQDAVKCIFTKKRRFYHRFIKCLMCFSILSMPIVLPSNILMITSAIVFTTFVEFLKCLAILIQKNRKLQFWVLISVFCVIAVFITVFGALGFVGEFTEMMSDMTKEWQIAGYNSSVGISVVLEVCLIGFAFEY